MDVIFIGSPVFFAIKFVLIFLAIYYIVVALVHIIVFFGAIALGILAIKVTKKIAGALIPHS